MSDTSSVNQADRTRRKWDSAAAVFDIVGGLGPEKRWRAHKQRLFAGMKGRVLFVAVGTGLDIACFPPGQQIDGIDISPRMLEKAAPRAAAYPGAMSLHEMDVHEMDFPDNTFDQVHTSCTFCSVPDPIKGLAALNRALRPGGTLHMFEHTGSQVFPFGAMLNLLNPVVRHFGPEINRDTTANVAAAGFHITRVTNVYLDIVKTIEAVAPAEG